ncbi:MAG: prolipoprotein diacylglyceryl transferase [Clostridiales bacterium]|jgi:phosphatidylglycerol:prolipoprotein diacylglycerol transferase|nr:prolipoprotein diacylglyceryl transferase [Clostridiales bacterium]
MNPIAFHLFGQPIYWYGILISIGVFLGILLAMRNSKVFGLDQDSIIDFALLAIPLAIIGARLYYVIFEWSMYRENPLEIMNIRKGGLAIYGGVIGGILAGFIFTKWKKQNFWNLADICAPSLILGQAIGRWGNYVNQEAYGYTITDPKWQWFPAAVFIEADGKWHMATFFYESLWNFIVFVFLMYYRKRRKETGEVFLFYLILYSFGRFFIEGLRTDSLYIGTTRVSQLLSAVLFVVGIGIFIQRRKNAKTAVAEAEIMTAGASESISDASLENNSEKADDNQDSINQAEEANE